MLEIHGWITFRETYEVENDDLEPQYDQIMQNIFRKCEALKYNRLKPKAMNGEWYLETSLFANHNTVEVAELFDFLAYAAETASGSYGLFYVHDDEDRDGLDNEFKVFVIARGKIRQERDPFLSPFIPVVEDIDIEMGSGM